MGTLNKKSIALNQLLDYFGNNKQQVALSLGIHYQTVVGWQRRGQVGRKGAVLIDQRPDVPFRKEQLRPDLFPDQLDLFK